MFDIDEWTNTVASLTVELCTKWTFSEREEVFEMGSVLDIFKTYSVSYIKMKVESC